MSKLSDSRRWINRSKLQQSVLNPRQGTYTKIVPGGVLDGGQFADGVKNLPYFQEITEHLGPRQLVSMIEDEEDIDLLTHMANVERMSTDPRSNIVKLFEKRVEELEKEKAEAKSKAKAASK